MALHAVSSAIVVLGALSILLGIITFTYHQARGQTCIYDASAEVTLAFRLREWTCVLGFALVPALLFHALIAGGIWLRWRALPGWSLVASGFGALAIVLFLLGAPAVMPKV